MDDEQIKQLGKKTVPKPVFMFTEQDIIFLAFYRASFPEATILPKMHHMVPWFRRWHLGFGIMGEQGAESIHAHLMKLERQHEGIANKVERYQQLLESDPYLASLRPSPQKRPRTTSSEDQLFS